MLTTVVTAGIASAQSSYPCTETNSNLPNPYRQVANWASPPRPWSPVNAVAVDRNNNLWAVDRCETDDCVPVIELGPDGKTLRNFGLAIDNNDMLYVADSQSSLDAPSAANYNPGCQRGIRIGSVKDGKVMYFIPPPVPPDPKMQPPIGVVVDGNGAIYAASDDQKDVKKYVRN